MSVSQPIRDYSLKVEKDASQLKKNALYLSVNVFSTKVLIGDTIFTSLAGDGTAIYVVIRATRRSGRLQCKGSTFFSQLF